MVTPGMVVTTSVMPICFPNRMSASLSGRDTMASRIMVPSLRASWGKVRGSRAGRRAGRLGRAEVAVLQLRLSFIDGARAIRGRKRQADGHVRQARRNEVRVAAQEAGLERLPIGRLLCQWPGVAGAILVEQQTAR